MIVKNKGSKQVILPNRKAMQQLTRGSPIQQSLGNYAKMTPSGASLPTSDILTEGDQPSVLE